MQLKTNDNKVKQLAELRGHSKRSVSTKKKKKPNNAVKGEPARSERIIWIGNETGRRAGLHENKCDSKCVPISAVTPRSVCSLQLPELSLVERIDG